MTSMRIKTSRSPCIPISWGELFDKISILEIKKDLVIKEDAKQNIWHEFNLLNSAIPQRILNNSEVLALRHQLKEINQKIWNIENEIRIKESKKEFTDRFIELARNTYLENDRRAAIKKQINIMLNSAVVEEKVY